MEHFSNKFSHILINRNDKGEKWLMIKEIAWNTFKNTGSINTFLELKQIENFEHK